MDHLTNFITIGHAGCVYFFHLDIFAVDILVPVPFIPNVISEEIHCRSIYQVGIKLCPSTQYVIAFPHNHANTYFVHLFIFST